MIHTPFSGILGMLMQCARRGTAPEVDRIMSNLDKNSSLAMTRKIDFALSLVSHPQGIERIRYYLFHGSQIQRNYAALYFNRAGDWPTVKEAYQLGLIDEIQAYAR